MYTALRIFFILALTTFSSIFANQKVVLFNDTSAWYHWGCTGTSTALKEGIQKLGFDIQAVPINVTYALKEVPQFEEFNDPQKFDRFCEENRDSIEAIQHAVAVVITGEGTIHDLRAGPKALLYLAHISKKFFRKHVEIINHSAYPKDDPDLSARFLGNFEVEKEKAEWELKQAQAIYKTIYAELDFVAIRESFSQDEMRKIGISSALSFDCLPLYIRDHYRTKKQVKEKTLVVAGSVAFSETGAEKLCHYIASMAKTGFEIKVLIGAAAFPSKDDQSFVNFLKMHCTASWDLIVATSMEEWLDTINHATLLVSGRFHHSIAAFCLNTPFIALNSNTHKVHAICSLLEQPEPLLFSDPRLLDHLLLRTNAIISSPQINNSAKVAEVCQLAQRNFDGLKSLMEGLYTERDSR
jgi:polysaccharide pyruvyl transferase WcaK-like protein